MSQIRACRGIFLVNKLGECQGASEAIRRRATLDTLKIQNTSPLGAEVYL